MMTSHRSPHTFFFHSFFVETNATGRFPPTAHQDPFGKEALWGSVQLGAGSGDYEAGRRERSQGIYSIVVGGSWNKVFVEYKAVS